MSMFFWVVTLCVLLGRQRRFGDTFYGSQIEAGQEQGKLKR
jgi:hypothetical protein